MKCKMEEYLDYRLKAWADWCLRRDNHGLGYPPINLIYRMMREGRVIINATGPRKEFVYEEAEEIENLVKEMLAYKRKMAEALRKDCLGPEVTILGKARAVGMSETQFRLYLSMAKEWLIGRLSAYRKQVCSK